MDVTKPRGQTIIPDPPVANLSKEMFALPEAQRRFVMAMVEYPGRTQADCAMMAGYTGHAGTLSSTANRLLNDPKVQAAIQSEARKRMTSATIVAASKLVEHIENGDPKVSLRAIEMLLNRTGFHQVSEQNINVKREPLDDKEKLQRINLLAADLGIDAARLLGRSSVKLLETKTIDAEFTVVSEGTEGLEDLL